MKKIILLSTMVFAIFSCQNANKLSHREMMDRIDKMDISEKIYEVKMHDDGSRGDTMSITYLKKDTEGKTLYKKVNRFSSGWQSEVYFNDNEDEFFRKSKNSRNVQTIQEHFFMDDTLLRETQMLVTEEGETDTFIVNFVYSFYPGGNVRRMAFFNLTGQDTTYNFIHFNESGKRIRGATIENGDTISKFENIFKNEKLLKTKYKFRNRDQVDYFDIRENRIKSDIFTLKGDSMVLARELSYTYDENGNMLTQTVRQPEWNHSRQIEYFRVVLE